MEKLQNIDRKEIKTDKVDYNALILKAIQENEVIARVNKATSQMIKDSWNK